MLRVACARDAERRIKGVQMQRAVVVVSGALAPKALRPAAERGGEAAARRGGVPSH